jgi:hypothetical protein
VKQELSVQYFVHWTAEGWTASKFAQKWLQILDRKKLMGRIHLADMGL